MRSWQSSRELVKMIYDLTNLPNFSHDFALRDQIRRAVISVMSNIAEGSAPVQMQSSFDF